MGNQSLHSNTETQHNGENNSKDFINNEDESPTKIEIKIDDKKIDSKVITKIHPLFLIKENNAYTFCSFKSIDDILYLVYIKEKYYINFYNIIDERKICEIVTNDEKIIELKYLFDEFNKRDLLFSISYKNIILWNVNTLECIFDLKSNNNCNFYHLGFLKENNKRYNFIVSHKKLTIYDLNGNKLNDYQGYIKVKNLLDYQGYLKAKNFLKHRFIDSYYDKKLNKNYIFMSNDNYELYSIDYEKNELYQNYYSRNKPKNVLYNDHSFKESENFQIIFNESEGILKIIFPLYKEDSIGIFNFHSGKMIYKIDLNEFKNGFFGKSKISDIYSISFMDDNYIILSIGKNKEFSYVTPNGLSNLYIDEYHTYHSIQLINLKEKKMVEVLNLKVIDEYITNKNVFVKNIFHPKYKDCLLIQDSCGEIIIMKINL